MLYLVLNTHYLDFYDPGKIGDEVNSGSNKIYRFQATASAPIKIIDFRQQLRLLLSLVPLRLFILFFVIGAKSVKAPLLKMPTNQSICYREQLKKQLEQQSDDTKAARAQTNEEKSLKLFQEKRVKDFEGKLAELEAEHDNKIAELKSQIDDAQTENDHLQSQVSYTCSCSFLGAFKI